jgi:hypothetical protein
MLYIVSDLLHHARYHQPESEILTNVTRGLLPFLLDLLCAIAAGNKTRVSRRVQGLLDLWRQDSHFDSADFDRLLDASTGNFTNDQSEHVEKATIKNSDTAFVLPSTHGDPSLPYHDLPAANLMRYIVPNSSQAIRPEEVRPLQLQAGPADENLVNALKDFLADVDGANNSLTVLQEAGLAPEIDEMGQVSYYNEAGDLVGDTYYGWSRAFCERMKKRDRARSTSSCTRSRSRGSSRGRSVSPPRRRRRSRSISESGSSRSPRRRRFDSRGNGRPSLSRSKSRSRSRDPPKGPSFTLAPTQNSSDNAPTSAYNPHNSAPPRASYNNQFAQPPAPPPPVMPPMQSQMPFAPKGFPTPPPRPPNWQGPWPPPPPPPFPPVNMGGQGFAPASPSNFAYQVGIWPPPPPPPPPNGPSGYGTGYPGRR